LHYVGQVAPLVRAPTAHPLHATSPPPGREPSRGQEDRSMVPLMSLWLPIVVAAVFVFIASSIIHMVLGYHKNDYQRLPNEDAVMAALSGTPVGEYVTPHAQSMAAMKDPAYLEKANRGPVAAITVAPNGVPDMRTSLAVWFVYCLLVGLFAGYISSRALQPGADYLEVFRFAGATAFAGYGLALLQGPIWYFRRWSTTLVAVFDGFVYALVTAGVFGWLWPQ
jgi:hypothetical protein